jgi:hypothetical protein
MSTGADHPDASASDPYQVQSLSQIHGEWAALLDQSARLDDPAFHDETLALARAMMRRARTQVERLIDWLHQTNYEFAHRDRIWIAPRDENLIAQHIVDAAQHGVHFPLSFQAWLFEVGSVNLMGSHPDWPFRGYQFDDQDSDSDKPLRCADPLVVEFDADYPLYLKNEWDERVQSHGAAAAGPLSYDFSPDHRHKANQDGGAPYSFLVSEPSIDALVFDCRHLGSFVGHLRHALAWGGFPGLEYLDVDVDVAPDPRAIGLEPF